MSGRQCRSVYGLNRAAAVAIMAIGVGITVLDGTGIAAAAGTDIEVEDGTGITVRDGAAGTNHHLAISPTAGAAVGLMAKSCVAQAGFFTARYLTSMSFFTLLTAPTPRAMLTAL